MDTDGKFRVRISVLKAEDDSETIGYDVPALFDDSGEAMEEATRYLRAGQDTAKRCAFCGAPMFVTVRGHHHTENGVDVTQ